MPIPKNYPLESFDPRFEQLLLRGARGEDFVIPCESTSQATRLQHMLLSYRHRAKQQFGDEQREKWQPLFTAAIGLQKDAAGKKTIVHIYSRHAEFGSVLNNIMPSSAVAPALDSDPLADFPVTANEE